MRVIAPDVGGGFGYKGKLYPEESIVACAARRLRRPVRWVATRAESFVADNQGRDHAPRPSSRSTRTVIFSRCTSTHLPISAPTSRPSARLFRARSTARCWPASIARRRSSSKASACSPTRSQPMPTAAPAGRRPATCWNGSPTVRRDKLGLDRAEIRRRNLIPASAMPYKTPIGPTYDCGDFPRLLARALALADYRIFEARRTAGKKTRPAARASAWRATSSSSGVAPSRFAGALGARVGFYEAPRFASSPTERCARRSAPTTTARATPPRLRRSWRRGLACRSRKSTITEGDTDLVPYGTGTFGSRSIAVGGCALDRAAGKIIAKGKLIAAPPARSRTG